MPVTCDITFDENEFGTYFTGQTITGKATLTVDKQKEVQGVALKIYGYAQTSLSGRSHHRGHGHHGRRHRSRHRRTFEGREDYLSSTTFFVGSEDPSRVTIEPGTHSYSFSCAIPYSCPSSFESTDGHIRYIAKVVLVRPWKFDETFSVGFTVLKRVDLNTESSVIKIPITMDTEKSISCGFFSKRPIKLRATIPHNGYVPGQSIIVSAYVENETSNSIKGLRFALNLIATYITDTPRSETKVEKINLAKVKTDPIDKESKKSFTGILRVPATPPSCPDLCRIIQIAYEVDVMAKISGVLLSPSVVIPIIVGNVPLVVPQPQPIDSNNPPKDKKGEATATSTATAIASAPAQDINSAANPIAGSSTSTDLGEAGNDPNALPPTYEEAMFMSSNNVSEGSDSDRDQHEDGDDDANDCSNQSVDEVTFTPRYPVLDMSPLQEQDTLLIDLSSTPNETNQANQEKPALTKADFMRME